MTQTKIENPYETDRDLISNYAQKLFSNGWKPASYRNFPNGFYGNFQDISLIDYPIVEGVVQWEHGVESKFSRMDAGKMPMLTAHIIMADNGFWLWNSGGEGM